MNGLDLTSWIEKASTVGMIQTVCAVAALISGGLCFFVFVTSFGSEPSKLKESPSPFLWQFSVSLICGTPTGIYHRTELSETQFNRTWLMGTVLPNSTVPCRRLSRRYDDFTTCTAVPRTPT